MASKSFWGDLLLLDEEVDQRLHWFHLLIGHKLVVLCDSNEVHKAHVQDFVLVDMPERVLPMTMVEMRIAPEHLLHDPLAILVESLREATALSDPVLARKRIDRGIEVGGSGGDGGCCSWSAHVAGGVSCGRRVGSLGREHDRVMDLAHDPLLHAVDELGRGDFGGPPVDQPGVGEAIRLSEYVRAEHGTATYRPADMVGQVVSLQIGRPVTPLVS